MSVVRKAAARRWAAVLGGVLVLAAVPPALAALPVEEPAASAAATGPDVLARVRSTEPVPHSGLVEVRGRLGLPTLPRLDQVTRLLDNTTRLRVWWADPRRWRVATLTPTGERDIARISLGSATWDYDANTLVYEFENTAARLPRADDLLPPQAVRRLLAGLSAQDRVERIEPRRVAGRTGLGLRVVPGDARSSVAHLDVWVDEATALPIAFEVFGVGYRSPILTSSFLDLDLSVPDRATTSAATRPPPGRSWVASQPDLAATIDRFQRWQLPQELAGLPRVRLPGTLGGVATYGDGLTRFVVLALPSDVSGEALRRGREITRPVDIKGGRAVPLHRPLLSVLLARGDASSQAYLLAGTVRPEVLTAAAEALINQKVTG